MILAYDSKAVNNALSEGGQICPLDSKCDKQNDNQTDTHNMTLNVPNSGKSENGQGSVASSILNNSNGSQNQTNLGNTSSLNGEINNSIRNMINITTDKQIYNPGEKVNISIKNIGVEQLTFPNSALGLTIRNLASKELYPILSSQVITILSPGDSKSLEWDQMGNDGNQAPSGNYSASVKSGINSAETTFTIK
jgi:flagellar hook assembly protein FlgD